MAGLPDKLVAQVAFKAGGDVFHQLLGKRPHHFAKVTPGKVQACELHHGEFGTEGAVIEWKYTIGMFNWFLTIIFMYSLRFSVISLYVLFDVFCQV